MASDRHKIAGLDQWRFIAALFVVITHTVGEPAIFHWCGLNTNSGLCNLLNGAYWKFFFVGGAGVILFFIISGFCIHYPNSQQLRIGSLSAYFGRRYLRIAIPVIPILIYYWFGQGMNPLEVVSRTVLWSIVCEVIYYTIYPPLLIIRRNFISWWPLIVTSYLASIVVAMIHPHDKSMWFHFGPSLTWILGLPAWLLGAELADRIRGAAPKKIKTSKIWLWRFGAVMLAWLTVVMTFRGGVGDPWTLNIFALFVYFWMKQEISNSHFNMPNRYLELFGLWSYSLYLTHLICWPYWVEFTHCVKPLSPCGYAGSLLFILTVAYCYYLVCERPAHQLSRAFSRWLGSKKTV